MKTNEKIIALRKKLNWQQKELVIASGLSQATICKIERDLIKFDDSQKRQKIAVALQVNLNDLKPDEEVVKKIIVRESISDEEAIVSKFLQLIKSVCDTESKYEYFNELFTVMTRRIEQRENFKRFLQEDASCGGGGV
jgi:transcriptional regulator with XRE-family HTH domain